MATDNDIAFYKNEFNTDIMYYYIFNKSLSNKNKDLLKDLIETHNGVYKIVYELSNNFTTTLVDFDQLDNKDLLYDDNYNISKLFVLKKSETKNNMIYSNFNNVLKSFSSDTTNTTNTTNFDLYLKLNSSSDDSDLNLLLLRMLLDDDLILLNNKFSNSDNTISSTSPDIERIKLNGSIIQLFPTVQYLNSRFEIYKQSNTKPENLNVYSQEYMPKMLKIIEKSLNDITTNPEKYTNMWFDYSIKSIMY